MSGVNDSSVKSDPMSDALSSRAWRADAASPDDEDGDDDELVDELFVLLDEVDDDEVEDDDGLALDVAARLPFFLPSSRVRRKAAMAMAATASTPTTIHFALLDAAPGAPGGTGGTGGIAAVAGGSAAATGWVASPWKSGCCSGGYHLPSDACHQPSPCPVSLTDAP